MPRLILITAFSPEIRKVRRSRALNFQQITMPYLAARVPPGWEVIHVDEDAEAIDWDLAADVVGLTYHTPSAFHAYELAARFRARGSCVVMGGPHVTLLPGEARQHADVIFIGEAEGAWEDFLKNFEAGAYQRVYQPTSAPSLENVPMAHKDLFHRHDHTSGVLFASRGCPSQCDFCTIAVMYPHKLRVRPVAEVAAEYASFKGKVIIFWDDNLAGDMRYAKALFRAIAPYRKWWSSQASLQAGRDDEFLEAAAQSGCKQLFLGLENATFNIPTPFPGTPLFRRLEAEGCILTRDWRKYNSRTDVVYQPRQMSAAELLAGFQYANARFYSLPSIAKRLFRSPAQSWWALPLNLAYGVRWRMTAQNIKT